MAPLTNSTKLQLSSFLAEHNVQVLQLFRQWDQNGDGALDKKELRRAVRSLGYYASTEDVDELFKACDHSGDGLIDHKEMKHALNCFLKGVSPSPRTGHVVIGGRPPPARKRAEAELPRVIVPSQFDWHSYASLLPTGAEREAMEARRKLWNLCDAGGVGLITLAEFEAGLSAFGTRFAAGTHTLGSAATHELMRRVTAARPAIGKAFYAARTDRAAAARQAASLVQRRGLAPERTVVRARPAARAQPPRVLNPQAHAPRTLSLTREHNAVLPRTHR